MVTGRYTAFSNNKKMVTILHRELEHKVEKVKLMKLEVMLTLLSHVCHIGGFQCHAIQNRVE